jgi:hypothetical protein
LGWSLARSVVLKIPAVIGRRAITVSEIQVGNIIYGICFHAIAHRHFDVTGVTSHIFAANNLTAAERERVCYAKGRHCHQKN